VTIEAPEHQDPVPHDLLIPLDRLRYGLQYEPVCDVRWRSLSGGGFARGVVGEHSGEVRSSGCGAGLRSVQQRSAF